MEHRIVDDDMVIAFDHQAMKRVHKALNQLPAGPASRVAAKTSR